MQRFLISIALASALVLGGCSIYKLDIQQGNYFSDEMVAKLKPGMTRKQVLFVMGTPIVSDPFHKDRWDYVYTNQEAGGEIQRKHLVVYFENDTLDRIERRPNATLK